MTVSKQKKLIFGIVYSMVLVFTLCFSGLVISSYIKEKQEFEQFKQTWQYRADTNFTQSIKTDEETGEQVVVYNISTPEQLAGMFVHSEKVQADSATSHYVNGKYQLTQNLSLSASSWSSSSSFSGTFYGNGFVISGIGSPFVNSLTGTVKDIVFENVRISMSGNAGVVANSSTGTITNVQVVSGSISGSLHVGGIVGSMTKGSIVNCSNKATVSGGYNIGGIVGYAYAGSVENCINYGSISSSNTNSQVCVGGIVGYTYSAKVYLGLNHGTVSANTNCSTGLYVGGVAGRSNYYISQCANYSNVTATNKNSSAVYAGGVVGYADGTVMYAYNGGKVSATNGSLTKTSSSLSNWSSTTSVSVGSDYYVCSGTYVSTSWNDTGAKEDTDKSYIETYNPKKDAFNGGIVGFAEEDTSIYGCYNQGSLGSTRSRDAHFLLNGKLRYSQWYGATFTKFYFDVSYTDYYTFGYICGNQDATISSCYSSNVNSSISQTPTVTGEYNGGSSSGLGSDYSAKTNSMSDLGENTFRIGYVTLSSFMFQIKQKTGSAVTFYTTDFSCTQPDTNVTKSSSPSLDRTIWRSDNKSFVGQYW